MSISIHRMKALEELQDVKHRIAAVCKQRGHQVDWEKLGYGKVRGHIVISQWDDSLGPVPTADELSNVPQAEVDTAGAEDDERLKNNKASDFLRGLEQAEDPHEAARLAITKRLWNYVRKLSKGEQVSMPPFTRALAELSDEIRE